MEAPIDEQERENYNASRVMRYVREYEAGQHLRLTEKMIKQIHALTTEGIKNPLNEPGKYRRDYVYTGVYEYPAPKDVPVLMKSFITFINSAEAMALHPIIRAVIAHFYFVSIHPFGDGNGRVARAIETFLLFHGGYDAAGFYSLANYYYRNRREYIKQLDNARFKHDGDLTEFAGFALNGFLLELTDIYNQAIPYMQVIKYSQTIDALVAEGDLSQRLGVALKEIADMPDGLTSQEFIGRIPDWVRRLYRGRSERTLRYDLTLMKQSGLIEKVDGRIGAKIEATR
jgi:Fic family protein